MKRILISLTMLFPFISIGQNSEYQMKKNSDEIEANFLSSYYQQDGNNAAVTGGIGTEELKDFANVFIVNIPLDSINAISVTTGVDYYTSASTDMIDNRMSSASRKDVRTYGTINYIRKNLSNNMTYGFRLGGSTEYDYNSISGGFSLTKEWNEGNSEVSLSGQAFVDQWTTYYPVELRSKVSVPTKGRQSYNLSLVYAQVLTKRMQMSISAEAIYMKGLLSTPFHRVYFEDGGLDIERLPESRLKIPASIRLNIFPFDNFIIRTYYRYYQDDFGIKAHTASIETPIKLSNTFTVYPFYRYHTQSAADYFAPFEQHLSSDAFYTSDYDLSNLSSHKFGIGFRYAPLYGIGRAKIPFTKRVFNLKYLQMRGSVYKRDTGLNGFSISLDLGMSINKKKN